jgi:transposase-like protein
MKRYAVQDFEGQFPDDDACLEFLKNARWPKGIFCQRCQKITKYHRITSKRVYSCDRCGTQVSPTANTIFHKSPTPLRHWFYAMFLMASTRTGISAKQLERELGVTYKTAWRMFTEIRKLMADEGQQLNGEVEIDDTYVGGKRPGKRGRGAEGKTIVVGMAQRNGQITTKVIPDIKAATVIPEIRQRIATNSIVFTDELHSYDSLGSGQGYLHYRVNHADGQYVNGIAHTNTIEGFWSLAKRGIDGVHHCVSPQYLQSYMNEYAFRYNHRKDEQPMFVSLLDQVPSSAERPS